MDTDDRLPGIYVAVKFDQKDNKFLSDHFINAGIKKFVSPNDLHITLAYAEGIDYFEQPKSFKSLVGSLLTFYNTSYKAFGKDEDTLVMAFDSPFLTNQCRTLESLGMIHYYKEYSPHMTLSTNYNGTPPLDILNAQHQLPFYKRTFRIDELVWEPVNQ